MLLDVYIFNVKVGSLKEPINTIIKLAYGDDDDDDTTTTTTTTNNNNNNDTSIILVPFNGICIKIRKSNKRIIKPGSY